ncbi:hypothetical protein F5X97DRAFT_342512 [Nemania serpens]|nr:hypothetical protein F5X97DRAFT_342512 [Nemania serpens]
MAEVLGTIIAGAQAVDYSLQIFNTINSIADAARNSERYREIAEQLKEIIEKVRDSPHLQTPIILRCTTQLITTINDTHQRLYRRKPNQLLASISFVMKQKKYDKIFDDIEQQKSTLALYISQLNNEKLGEISPTVDKIWGQLRRDSERQAIDTEIQQRKGNITTSIEECHRTFARPFITRSVEKHSAGHRQGNTETPICHPTQDYHERHCHNTQLNTSRQIEVPSSPASCMESVKQDATSSPIDSHSRSEGKAHPNNTPKLPPPRMETSPNNDSQETSPMSSLPFTEFEGNVHRGGGIQTVGVQIGPGVSMTKKTDAQILKATSNFRAHANVFAGDGTQVIGQRVRAGATARQFAGYYYNNHHKGSGDQIVGIVFEG